MDESRRASSEEVKEEKAVETEDDSAWTEMKVRYSRKQSAVSSDETNDDSSLMSDGSRWRASMERLMRGFKKCHRSNSSKRQCQKTR